jgi:hypothetical protein
MKAMQLLHSKAPFVLAAGMSVQAHVFSSRSIMMIRTRLCGSCHAGGALVFCITYVSSYPGPWRVDAATPNLWLLLVHTFLAAVGGTEEVLPFTLLFIMHGCFWEWVCKLQLQLVIGSYQWVECSLELAQFGEYQDLDLDCVQHAECVAAFALY